jgi:ankyrin repeat protein
MDVYKTIEDLKQVLITSNFLALKNALTDYNINERDKFGNDILHYYLLHAKDLSLNYQDVIDELINRGININSKQSVGKYQRSYLQMSVVLNIRDVFDFLLSKGADVNSTDANGNSILSDAVMNYPKDQDNYGYYIEKLLNDGANPFQENNYGVSARSLALSIANYDVKKYFENIDKSLK